MQYQWAYNKRDSGTNHSSIFKMSKPYTGGFMTYSHYTGMGLGQEQGIWMRLMGSIALYRNIYTDPEQRKEPGSIVFCCAGLIPCTCPGPVQCE